MSLMFLVGFILSITGEIQPISLTDNTFIAWALFAIADALWIRLLGNTMKR